MSYIVSDDPNTPSDSEIVKGAAAEIRRLKLRQQVSESAGNTYTDIVVQQAISEYQALIAPPTTASVGGTIIGAEGQQLFTLPVTGFSSATVYINGVHQALTDVILDGNAGTLLLSEPIYEGDVISYIVGENDSAIMAINASVQPAPNTIVQRTGTGNIVADATLVTPSNSFYVVMENDATNVLSKCTKQEFINYLGIANHNVSSDTVYSADSIFKDTMPLGSPVPLGSEVASESPLRSAFIPVRRGETLYLEILLQQVGTSARAYLGLERYDKDKKPIAINEGVAYMPTVSNLILPQQWTKYSAAFTMHTSHTPYNGSDGDAVAYVKVRLLRNYQSSGIARYAGLRLYRKLDDEVLLHPTTALNAGASGNLELVRLNGTKDTVAIGSLVASQNFSDIGSYMFATHTGYLGIATASIVSGSSLVYANVLETDTVTLAGSWRLCGKGTSDYGQARKSLWQRVS